MNKLQIKAKTTKGASLPAYQSLSASGCDLSAHVKEAIRIRPHGTALIPTGLSVQIPEGYEGQVRSRSGLSLKKGLVVLNAPGTIDADYRGEIKVILHNSSEITQVVAPGERIAQLVFAPVVQAEFVRSEELEETARGEGGFGSTGSVKTVTFPAAFAEPPSEEEKAQAVEEGHQDEVATAPRTQGPAKGSKSSKKPK